MSENEELENEHVGEIEIGTFNLHLASIRKGMQEFKIWPTLSIAIVSMAMPNSHNRIDLTNKETLNKIEKELGVKIDYDYIDQQIAKRPCLIKPNGFKDKADPTMDSMGKKVSKKQLKINLRKEKMQTKIDSLKKKHKAIKNKKCDRALKLVALIDELSLKRDRL